MLSLFTHQLDFQLLCLACSRSGIALERAQPKWRKRELANSTAKLIIFQGNLKILSHSGLLPFSLMPSTL
jgi:hypothetical protein